MPPSRRRSACGRLGPASATLAAALSAAVAMNPAWCIMIETSCRPSRRGVHGAVLDVERFTNHRPAVVHLAEPVLVVDADVAVVHDVGAVTVDGADALDLDARRVERDQEHGEALVLRRIRDRCW